MIKEIRSALKALANKEIRQSAKAFFKEEIKTYGIRNAEVRAIAKDVLKHVKEKNKIDVFALCEQLWQSGYLEESIIACDLSYSQRKKFDPEDFELFEKWIGTYVNNWASCDTFCNHTVGAFILEYPEYVPRLKKWATAMENRWLRRAAAVSLIIPARNGKFLKEVLTIAKLELEDRDDMVQKGYGWMLKVASQKHEQQVFDFVIKYKGKMPRTALRYAIEKMPPELKRQAMAK